MCKWRRHFKLNVKLRQSQNKDSYERDVFGSLITKYVQRIWRSSRGGEDRNMLELYFILRPVLCGRTVDRLVVISLYYSTGRGRLLWSFIDKCAALPNLVSSNTRSF